LDDTCIIKKGGERDRVGDTSVVSMGIYLLEMELLV